MNDVRTFPAVQQKIILAVFFALFIVCSFAYPDGSPEESDFIFAKKAFNDGFYDLSQSRLEAFLKYYPQTPHIYEAHTLLGRSYYKQNNLGRAIDEFEIVLSRPAGSAFQDDALYWSGEIYLKNGDYKKALELYQKLIDAYPASKYVGYAVYSKGWAYYKLGLFEEAVQYFRNVAVKYPFEKMAVDARFRSGECEYLMGRYDKAETALSEFVNKYPVSENTAEAYYMIGEAKFYQGKYADSVVSFERALSIEPKAKWAPFAVYRLGRCFYQEGDYGRSAREFRRCIDTADNDFLQVSSMLGLVEGFEKTAAGDEALKLCDEIIAKYPSTDLMPEVYYRKVRILYSLGEYAPAERLCVESIAKFQSSPYADSLRYELGWIYAAQKKYDDSIIEFTRVEKTSKDINMKSSGMCKVGDIYFERNDYQNAVESYDIVLEKYPDSFWADYAQYQVGNIFLQTGKYDQASLAYQGAIANFPNTSLRPKIIFQLGVAYFKGNDFERAAAEFSDFLKEFPSDGMATQAKMYLANSLYNLERYKEAIALYRELAAGPSGPADYRMMAAYQTAWCYYNLDMEQEAVEAFGSFANDYPASDMLVDVMFWFGQYYKSKGQYEKAKEYFKAITEKYPESDMIEEAFYQLALSSIEELRVEEAVAWLEKLQIRFPNSMLGRAAYRKMAKSKKDAGDPAAAIEYFKRSLSRDDDELNSQTQYEIAECYEDLLDLKKAVEEYMKVSYLYGKGVFWSVRAQLKAAQLFERMDLFDDAKLLYEKLAAMDVQESEFAKKRIEWLKWRSRK